jgi:hypothetical protein
VSTLSPVKRWAIFAAATLVAGCAEPRARPSESLFLLPEDLTTGVEGDDTLVVAQVMTSFMSPKSGSLGLRYDEEERESLARSVHVSRVRDGSEVPGTATFVDLSGPAVQIAFQPWSPLTRGWHQVELDVSALERPYLLFDLSGGTRIAFYPDEVVSGGLPVAHFFVGSLPVVRVSIAGDDSRDLFIRATEPLRLADPSVELISLVSVRSGATPLFCSLVPAWRDLEHGSFRISCGDYDTSVPLTVLVEPGLESLEGVPLRDHLGRETISVTWTPDETPTSSAPRMFTEALLALE